MKKILLKSILFLTLCSAVGCSNSASSSQIPGYPVRSKEFYLNCIKNELGVIIPKEVELEEVYWTNLLSVSPGMYPTYYIFSFDDEPTNFLKEYNFCSFDEKEKLLEEYKIMVDLIKENISFEMHIPNEKFIDFTKDYLIVQRPPLYNLIYYVDDYKLIVYQHRM